MWHYCLPFTTSTNEAQNKHTIKIHFLYCRLPRVKKRMEKRGVHVEKCQRINREEKKNKVIQRQHTWVGQTDSGLAMGQAREAHGLGFIWEGEVRFAGYPIKLFPFFSRRYVKWWAPIQLLWWEGLTIWKRAFIGGQQKPLIYGLF